MQTEKCGGRNETCEVDDQYVSSGISFTLETPLLSSVV
jgi:hypothetical protein